MKYIDADKLIERLEEMKRAEYENCGGVNSKTGALQEVQELINSLQQEQPIQINTLTWNDINHLERIINNVHYEFRNGIGAKSFGEEVLERFREERGEQEQSDVDLEKLGEIARHLIAVKDHEEDMRLYEDEWSLLERIGYPQKLNARK